jgi:hypothetical protein
MMEARGRPLRAHLEAPVDKKAKTPKKPKTAKPKTKTA